MLNLLKKYQVLEDINRCNCLPRLRNNSVKAHSAGVAMAAYLIADYEMKQDNRVCINKEELLVRALVHDLEEAYSGDVPYPFKKVRGVRSALKSAVDPEIGKLLKNHLDLYAKWRRGKDSSLLGRILAYADMLDLIIYCMEEIELGNRYMIEVAEEAVKAPEAAAPGPEESTET